jgi:hypothetical protein
LKDFGLIFGKNKVVGVLLGNGILTREFQNLNAVFVPANFPIILSLLSKILPKNNILIFNSLVTQKVSSHFVSKNRTAIALIHELPSLIKDYHLEGITPNINLCQHIVFPSEYVRDAFLENYPIKSSEKIHIVQQGMYQKKAKKNASSTILKRELGISDSAFLVVNLAYGDFRKAPDVFIATAINYARTYPEDDVHFTWIGGLDQTLKLWIDHDLNFSKVSSKVHIMNFRSDVENILDSLDCLYLTSREDPFPSTVIEAYYSDKPIILFDQGNGYLNMESKQFIFVEYQNVNKVTEEIKKMYVERPRFKHNDNLFYLSDVYAKKLLELTKL